jgi:hypothetical protein
MYALAKQSPLRLDTARERPEFHPCGGVSPPDHMANQDGLGVVFVKPYCLISGSFPNLLVYLPRALGVKKTRRRQGRFPRVRHGLKRLVVIGSSGMVTFEALRWLSSQDAAFLLLDRDGSVLAVSGPDGPSDARLRRAQSLAHESDVAVRISRELISQKLQGQERLVRKTLRDSATADRIASVRSQLDDATTVQSVRQIEALAAQAYWSAWYEVPVKFSDR